MHCHDYLLGFMLTGVTDICRGRFAERSEAQPAPPRVRRAQPPRAPRASREVVSQDADSRSDLGASCTPDRSRASSTIRIQAPSIGASPRLHRLVETVPPYLVTFRRGLPGEGRLLPECRGLGDGESKCARRAGTPNTPRPRGPRGAEEDRSAVHSHREPLESGHRYGGRFGTFTPTCSGGAPS